MKPRRPFHFSLFCVLMAIFLLFPALPKADESYSKLEIILDKDVVAVGDKVTFTLKASGNPLPDYYGYQIEIDNTHFESGGGAENTYSFTVPNCASFVIHGYSFIDYGKPDSDCGLLDHTSLELDVKDPNPLEAESSIFPDPVTAGQNASFFLRVSGGTPPYKIVRSVEIEGPGFYKTLFESPEGSEADSELTLKMPEYGESVFFSYTIFDSLNRMLIHWSQAPMQGGSAFPQSLSVNVQQEEIAKNKYRLTAVSTLSPPVEQAHFAYNWTADFAGTKSEKTEEGSNLMSSSFEFENISWVVLIVRCTLPDGTHLYDRYSFEASIPGIISEIKHNRWKWIKSDHLKIDPDRLPQLADQNPIPRPPILTLDNGKIIKIAELLQIKQKQNDAIIKKTVPKQINKPSNMQAPSNMQHLQDINLSPSLNNPNLLNPSLQPPQGNIPNLNIPGLNLNNPNPPSAP